MYTTIMRMKISKDRGTVTRSVLTGFLVRTRGEAGSRGYRQKRGYRFIRHDRVVVHGFMTMDDSNCPSEPPDPYHGGYSDKIYQQYNKDQKVDFYNNWAETYDAEYGDNKHAGPCMLASKLQVYLQDKCAEILDVAAGTGTVGIEKLGFKVIDALDSSPGMLEKARSKAVYRRYLCQFLTDQPGEIPSGSYDCVVMCSAIGSGHVPSEAFNEIIRITRSGGYVAIAANARRLHKEHGSCRQEFQEVFDKLENEGKWVKITEIKISPGYNEVSDGVFILYEMR